MANCEKRSVVILSADRIFAQMLELELEAAAGKCLALEITRIEDAGLLSESDAPDVLIADADGFDRAFVSRLAAFRAELCREMLTAVFGRSGEGIEGCRYFVRPFDVSELVRSVLDFTASERGNCSSAEEPDEKSAAFNEAEKKNPLCGLSFDAAQNAFYYGDERLVLTETELALLSVLYSKKGSAVSRAELLRLVWGRDGETSTNLTDVYIRYLREKIDDRFGVRCIFNVRGKGYLLK